MDKIGMVGISGIPSTRTYSHNAGWTYCLMDIAKNKFGKEVEIIRDPLRIHYYDKIIINEGINFKSGSFNFFGGLQVYTKELLNELTMYKGDCYSYNEKIDWSPIKKRKEIRDDEDMLKNFCLLPDVELLTTTKNGPDLIIGDSHALSIYFPGYSLSRNDGKTLHGFLKVADEYVDIDHWNNVTLYFGNIDIRFHIGRQTDPMSALDKLIKDYSNYAVHLMDHGIGVEIQGLLPIESEDRKIPGTGLYKGQPFYGSQENRQSWVDYFNEKMEENSFYYGFCFSRSWLYAPLDFKFMESKQSVHIRPQYYKYAHEFIGQVPRLF